MSQLGIDVFLKCLQKWGVPFIVAHVDTTQTETVNSVMQTFENMNIINGLVLDKTAVAELQESNLSGAADAHDKFLNFIHDQISLLLCGQTLGSNVKSTGLGSGTANLHSHIRDDLIKYDRACLDDCLRHQLFKQILEINGIDGCPPHIIWGSSQSMEECVQMSTVIMNLSNAGWSIDDDSIDDINKKFGFKLVKTSLPEEEEKPEDNKKASPSSKEEKDDE